MVVSEGDYVWRAVENVIERIHGFPAGCGYTDAWIEHEREQLITIYLKHGTLIELLRYIPGDTPAVGVAAAFFYDGGR